MSATGVGFIGRAWTAEPLRSDNPSMIARKENALPRIGTSAIYCYFALLADKKNTVTMNEIAKRPQPGKKKRVGVPFFQGVSRTGRPKRFGVTYAHLCGPPLDTERVTSRVKFESSSDTQYQR